MKLPLTPKAGIRPHPSNWTKEPEKAETHCLYCRQAIPDHKPNCVCLKRTVVVEMKIRYVVEVPQCWDEDFINFHRGESSYCLGNDIQQLTEEEKRIPNICTICHRAEVHYLREATEQDHKDLHFKASTDD